MYKCPYCNSSEYSKSIRPNRGVFLSWAAVRSHVIHCKANTHEYHICSEYGSIHYTLLSNKTVKQLRKEYPKLTAIDAIRKKFQKYGFILNIDNSLISNDTIINYIKDFYKEHNRIPQAKDFNKTNNHKYCGEATVIRHFGTWNAAIEAAGFSANYNNGFGERTFGKDNVLYRSKSEAYFVDTYLYGKYNYVYEVPYNDGTRKLYDFYIPELNLYIEIDGNCRPDVIKNKIRINKELDRQLLVITTNNLYNKNNLRDFL